MNSPRFACRLVMAVTLAALLAVAGDGLAAATRRVGASAEPATGQSQSDPRTEALARASSAVLGVSAVATDDAQSSDTLGRERQGSGVVIGPDGLVLTIGYLILEAERIDLHPDGGGSVPARVVAYDIATGFGLLQPLLPLKLAPVPLGEAKDLAETEPLMIASGADGSGNVGTLTLAQLVARRSFSGYWEYHIDGALFTAPARPDHSGAGLFNARGELVGIGSLLVADALGHGDRRLPGNMFVPVDLLKPILAELREHGSSRASTRPWLGLNCLENRGAVRVARVSTGSPAEDAGFEPGDLILKIDGTMVDSLEVFYKTLWSKQEPERDVLIEIARGTNFQTLKVHAVDRMTTLRKARGI